MVPYSSIPQCENVPWSWDFSLTLLDNFPANGTGWTGLQIQQTVPPTLPISAVSFEYYNGRNACKCFTPRWGTDPVNPKPKADIEKRFIAIMPGSTNYCAMYVWINAYTQTNDMYFIDFENQTFLSGAGVRTGLHNVGGVGRLRFERSKIGYGAFDQTTALPLGQWVFVEQYLKVGITDGSCIVKQNGVTVINTTIGATINSITRVTTTATMTTATPHSLTTGEQITVVGALPAAYNGTFLVTVTGASTLTYTMLSDPGATASPVGSYTAGICTQINPARVAPVVPTPSDMIYNRFQAGDTVSSDPADFTIYIANVSLRTYSGLGA